MSKPNHIFHMLWVIFSLASLLPTAVMSQVVPSPTARTCPFDDGRSSLGVEGLVLTRYALGLTGAALLTNSGIATTDAQTVQDSINSQTFDLRLTGNASMTPTDATIISRKLAGFSGASLTAGLALGSGSRNTPAAVQSFLLSGCPGTAWVQGGNAFGVPGVIGTTDGQPLTVVSGGATIKVVTERGDGMRVSQFGVSSGTSNLAANVVNGSYINSSTSGVIGATISGGGRLVLLAGTGYLYPNVVSADYGSIGGGYANAATGESSSVGGGNNNSASGSESVVGGGARNNAGSSATVGGGRINSANGIYSTVGGGNSNVALGLSSTVPGGDSNNAQGAYSFAAGRNAKAISDGCFVWADSAAQNFFCTAANQFVVRAASGVGINTNDPAGAQLHVVGPGDSLGTGQYEAMFSSNNDTQIALRSTSAGGRVWSLQSSNGTAPGSLAGSFQIVDRTAPVRARLLIDAAGNTYNTYGAWSVISDARLKKNIRDLDAPLETFLKLRGHRFEYKNPAEVMATPGERLGFVAQEVQQAVPQWVHAGADGMLSIVTTGFDALVVEAVRALRLEKDKEIAQVHAQNNAMTAALASRIIQLEASNAAAGQLRDELVALRRIVEALSANVASERHVATVIEPKDR